MQPVANQSDHRFKAGDRVEYGTRGIYGGDRLGEVVFEHREYGRDGYLIRPLSIGPGDGTLPSVYPTEMVHGLIQPERWAYGSNGWHRTYAEIPKRAREPDPTVIDSTRVPLDAPLERFHRHGPLNIPAEAGSIETDAPTKGDDHDLVPEPDDTEGDDDDDER